MARRKTFNVSLQPEERQALEYLRAKYPDEFDATANVVQRLIRERMVREEGPDWRNRVVIIVSPASEPEAIPA